MGGLGVFGYLAAGPDFMISGLSATASDIIVRFASVIVGNIPVRFAVLEMSHVQWLLVTPTVGVGGSKKFIGSAAGVAVMGQAKGGVTFLGHRKWP